MLRLYHTIRNFSWRQLLARPRNLIIKRLYILVGFKKRSVKSDKGAFSLPHITERLIIPQEAQEFIPWLSIMHEQVLRRKLELLSFDFLRYALKEEGIGLLKDWMIASPDEVLLEGHSLSRRIRNIIYFLEKHQITDPSFMQRLSAELNYLDANPEYHLRNNHLFENALALVWGGLFFHDQRIFDKGISLLSQCVKEQVLGDGAHFERSPYYHHLLLHGLLESLTLTEFKERSGENHETFVRAAAAMLGWSASVRFSSGRYPVVNDSVEHPKPSLEFLVQLAACSGILPDTRDLSESGFRMIRASRYELFLDVDALEPAAAPGHQHTDTFSFLLEAGGEDFLVEAGVTDYTNSRQRQFERSTAAHNTVTIDGINQSDVYGAFRAGKRNRIIFLEERKGYVSAAHDGYIALGATHRRSWTYDEQAVVVCDELTGTSAESGIAHLHVDKSAVDEVSSGIIKGKFVTITFEGAKQLTWERSSRAIGFNTRLEMLSFRVRFSGRLVTRLSFVPVE